MDLILNVICYAFLQNKQSIMKTSFKKEELEMILDVLNLLEEVFEESPNSLPEIKHNLDLTKFGLCYATYYLFTTRFITLEELNIARDYIKANRPDDVPTDSTYFYIPGSRKPRLEWLDKHIKLLTS